MKLLSIDRIEANFAICEDLNSDSKNKKDKDIKMFGISLNELPKGAKEGTILSINDEGEISIDYDEMQKRKEMMSKLQSRAFK